MNAPIYYTITNEASGLFDSVSMVFVSFFLSFFLISFIFILFIYFPSCSIPFISYNLLFLSFYFPFLPFLSYSLFSCPFISFSFISFPVHTFPLISFLFRSYISVPFLPFPFPYLTFLSYPSLPFYLPFFPFSSCCIISAKGANTTCVWKCCKKVSVNTCTTMEWSVCCCMQCRQWMCWCEHLLGNTSLDTIWWQARTRRVDGPVINSWQWRCIGVDWLTNVLQGGDSINQPFTVYRHWYLCAGSPLIYRINRLTMTVTSSNAIQLTCSIQESQLCCAVNVGWVGF